MNLNVDGCEPTGKNKLSDCEKTKRDTIDLFHSAKELQQIGASLASLDLSEARRYARSQGWTTPPAPFENDPGEPDFCPIHAPAVAE